MNNVQNNQVYNINYPNYSLADELHRKNYSFTSLSRTAHLAEECSLNNNKPLCLPRDQLRPRTFAIFCKTGTREPHNLLPTLNSHFLDKEGHDMYKLFTNAI
jgi:hypothetical protein